MFKKILFVVLFLPSLVLAQNKVTVINSNSSPVPVSDAGGSLTVDGTLAVTQSGGWTNACTQSGTWNIGTVTAVTGITNPVAVTQSGTWDEVGINDSGNSITVDGTVTVTDGAGALNTIIDSGTVAATQSGTWSNRLTDGTNTATVRDLGSSDSLNVAITDGSGNQITSFGGGTQYTEGDTDATITGTAIMFEANTGTSTLLPVSPDDPLPVTLDFSTLATLAEQQTQSTSLGNIETSAATIAGAVSGTEMQVDVVTSALPSGAATSANQSTEITSLQLLDDVVATDGAAALTKGNQIAGTDGTNAQILSTNASGHLNIADGGNTITVDGTVAATQSGTWVLGANSGVDIGDVTLNNATVAVTQSGTWDEVGINDSGNSITVDGTVTVTDGAGALNVIVDSITAGNNNIGDVDIASFPDNEPINVAQMNGTAVTMGNGAAGTGVQRVTIASDSTGVLQVIPGTTGGLSTYHLVSAATTNATNVKASAGQVCGWYIYNSNASMRKLAFHNTSGTPTAGASIFFTIKVPGGAAANVFSTHCIAFSSGIGITTVTGAADSNATAVASEDLDINLFYK